MSIGKRIFKIRNYLGLTQEKMASILGISQKHVSQIEKGIKIPSKHLMRLIGLSFNISEAWLMNGQGEMFVSLEEQLIEKLARYGKQAFLIAVNNVVEKYDGPTVAGRHPDRPVTTGDPVLDRMLKILYDLWSTGDSRLRGWIEIQFDRAFPADVVEKFKKKRAR